MSKLTTFIAALLAFSMFAFFSCKKSSPSSSPQSEIVGTWKLTGETVDTGAGVANYVVPTDTSWAHQLLTINSNGTALSTYYSSQSQSTWAFADNNTYLKVTDTGSNAGTYYYQIVTLNSTTFEVKDTSLTSLSLETYTKQ